MSAAAAQRTDILVIGAGPAGTMAALRAADLGARTTLVTSGAFGGMAANDGPVPVRTLAQAARLMREIKQAERYGVTVGEPVLDYGRLLRRVDGVVGEVARSSALRDQLEGAGVDIREGLGALRFVGPGVVEAPGGKRFLADRIILAIGGVARRLSVPGFELTASHSEAWSLTSVPPSLLVVGSGATGVQVASVFNAFGSRVQLLEAGGRILSTEEPEVSEAVAGAFRASGIAVRENFGAITAFEAVGDGVRMTWAKDGLCGQAEAAVVVVAIGWSANTAGLNLAAAGVEADSRGSVVVDACLRTSAPGVFAAGDVTGVRMLAPQALHAGFVAATNAVTGSSVAATHAVNPVGSFTEPEYAQVGLGEAAARGRYDVEVAIVGFDTMTRAIIDGRTTGFCKLIVERSTRRMLGCHLVGERAVDIAQVAAVAMAADMTVDDFARIPFSFPIYAGVLSRTAIVAARNLNREVSLWKPTHIGPADMT